LIEYFTIIWTGPMPGRYLACKEKIYPGVKNGTKKPSAKEIALGRTRVEHYHHSSEGYL